jgi:hypothetical protein
MFDRLLQHLLATITRHQRSGWTCLVLGVVGFCLLQGVIFLLMMCVGGVFPNDSYYYDDDDDIFGDEALLLSRSMFAWPKLFLSRWWHFFFTTSGLHYLFSPGFPYDKLDHQPILIIGGSDGSGTRAFVETIRELGAVVVSDDSESFDFHAAGLFHHQGWPGLINAVMNVTHTADYEWEDLIQLSSQGHADNIRKEIRSLMRSVRSKYDLSKRIYRRKYEERLKKGEVSEHASPVLRKLRPGNLPTLFPAWAHNISFVIKAPVSMLILPIFCKFYGKRIKFLHVIRE